MKIYFLLNLNNTTDALQQESLNICAVKKENIIEIFGKTTFGKSKTTFGKSKTTFGKSKTTFGKSKTTFGKSKTTFGKQEATFNSL